MGVRGLGKYSAFKLCLYLNHIVFDNVFVPPMFFAGDY